MKDWLENTHKFVKTANQLFILIKATLLKDRYDYVRVYEKYNEAYYLEEECEDEIWACVEQSDFDQVKKILNNVDFSWFTEKDMLIWKYTDNNEVFPECDDDSEDVEYFHNAAIKVCLKLKKSYYEKKELHNFDNNNPKNGFLCPYALEDIHEENDIKINVLQDKRCKLLFDKAIEYGIMKKVTNGYSWEKSKALLAYFTERVFCKDNNGKDNGKQYPETLLNKMFSVTRLGKARTQLLDNKRPPRGYEIIDKILMQSKMI